MAGTPFWRTPTRRARAPPTRSVATACTPVCGAFTVDCPEIEHFSPVQYGSENIDNKCDNGVSVSRMCSSEGVWEAVTYSGACSRAGRLPSS